MTQFISLPQFKSIDSTHTFAVLPCGLLAGLHLGLCGSSYILFTNLLVTMILESSKPDENDEMMDPFFENVVENKRCEAGLMTCLGLASAQDDLCLGPPMFQQQIAMYVLGPASPGLCSATIWKKRSIVSSFSSGFSDR